MSAEHDLAKEARRELMAALEAWALSARMRDKTLSPEEHALFEKYSLYRRFRRITGPYAIKRPDKA